MDDFGDLAFFQISSQIRGIVQLNPRSISSKITAHSHVRPFNQRQIYSMSKLSLIWATLQFLKTSFSLNLQIIKYFSELSSVPCDTKTKNLSPSLSQNLGKIWVFPECMAGCCYESVSSSPSVFYDPCQCCYDGDRKRISWCCGVVD